MRRHVLKIASRIKFLVSHVLSRELNDPRLGFVTVLDVEPTVDLREAKVKVSVLGSAAEISKTMHALEDAAGFIQRQVGQNLSMRHTPRLHFELDDRPDYQSRVEAILEETRREDALAQRPELNPEPEPEPNPEPSPDSEA